MLTVLTVLTVQSVLSKALVTSVIVERNIFRVALEAILETPWSTRGRHHDSINGIFTSGTAHFDGGTVVSPVLMAALAAASSVSNFTMARTFRTLLIARLPNVRSRHIVSVAVGEILPYGLF